MRRVLVGQAGGAPSELTVQRYMAREGLHTPRRDVVFGRLASGAANVLYSGDVLHGRQIGGEQTWQDAIQKNNSQFISGYRCRWREDTLHVAVALKRPVTGQGLPGTTTLLTRCSSSRRRSL